MDFHLTRGLRLKTEPEYKNLYKWAINEIDTDGKSIGRDQIPWEWTLNFTATSCVLGDSIEIDTESTAPKVDQRQVIRVTLRPGHSRDVTDTSYSMFGTDRIIRSFELHIHPITDASEHERCAAWGSVSYTYDDDFRKETTEDAIIFYLFVKLDTFARYAAKIAHGLVDEIILSVKSVDGFYSDWSPDIATDHVKVLTRGSEQNVTLPTGVAFEPPRLGRVGSADFFINRRLEFSHPDEEPSQISSGKSEPAPVRKAKATAEPSLLLLESVKRAMWWGGLLLGLILIVLILKR